jgi:O-antigen ligase
VLAWWLVLLLRRDSGRGVRQTVAIAAVALIPLLGLIYSASRGAVVAFLAALLVMLVLWLRDRRDNLFSWRRIGAGAAAVAVLAFVIVSGPVAKRDPQAQGEIGRILEQGVGQYVPQEYSSIGTRVVIWREGTRLWLEKPWFGHGPGPTEAFLAELKSRYRLFDSFDFENTYLELLVRIGLVGTLFFAFHLLLCGQSLRRGLIAGWYPPDAGRFLLLACGIFGVALFFREGLLELRGRNVATFLLAGLYSFQVANWTVTKTEPDAEPA